MQQRFAVLISAASLVVTAACSQTDAGITMAVESKMASDDRVKASDINVDTHNHVVTLNGTVASRAERDRAVLIARDTKGVNTVVDNLVVGAVPAATSGKYEQKTEEKTENTKAAKTHDAKAKSERAADHTGDVLTDAAITSELKTKFLAEPGVSGLNINVDTNNGVVTLSGTVKSKAEAAKAMALARESKGVKRVVSKLKVAA
jgi:hyperosmotically inducible periplasmic protein